MVWLICLIIALISIGTAVVFMVAPVKRKSDFLFISIVLAGFFSYLPHYLSFYDFFNSVIADIVNLLQIITLNSNTYESFQEVIPVGYLFYPYIVIRGIVHISLPILFAYVAFSFLFNYLAKIKQKIVCKGSREVFVFSEYNEYSELLAADIHRNNKNNTIVFLRDNVINDKKIDSAKDYVGNIEINLRKVVSLGKEQLFKFVKDMLCKNNKTIHVFFNEKNYDNNLNMSLELITYCKDNISKDDLDKIQIEIFAKSVDTTALLIDSINDNSLNVRIVDRDQIVAYNLLQTIPLYKAIKKDEDDNDILSITIIGGSECSVEIFRNCVWCGQLPDVKLEINFVVNIGKKNQLESLILRDYPELINDDYKIKIIESNLSLLNFENSDLSFIKRTGYIVISCGDDELNYNIALYLRRKYFQINNYSEESPYILFEIVSSLRKKAINMMNESIYKSNSDVLKIIPFGDIQSVYSLNELVDSKLYHLGKNVNFAYEEYFYDSPNFLKKEIISEKSRIFNSTENTKKSNIVAALHIQYKLWVLGYEYCDCDDSNKIEFNELRSVITNNNEMVEKLSRFEHDRWVAFYRSEGWRTETPENVKKIFENGLGKRNKSDFLKTHIDICKYEEIMQRRDILGLEDTTPLDYAIIKRIPDILEDRWALDTIPKKYYVKKTGGCY